MFQDTIGYFFGKIGVSMVILWLLGLFQIDKNVGNEPYISSGENNLDFYNEIKI